MFAFEDKHFLLWRMSHTYAHIYFDCLFWVVSYYRVNTLLSFMFDLVDPSKKISSFCDLLHVLECGFSQSNLSLDLINTGDLDSAFN